MFGGPATILFFAVVILPFFYGLYLTFTSWDGVSTTKPFVGLENYKAALADTAYWQSLGRTFIYSVIAVILTNSSPFCWPTSDQRHQGETSSVRASSFRTSSAASFWATCGSSSSTAPSCYRRSGDANRPRIAALHAKRRNVLLDPRFGLAVRRLHDADLRGRLHER